MDREEALSLLRGEKAGVEKWNSLRESGEEIPDLSGASLRKARLQGADLSGAQLEDANLSGAELLNVDLSKAVLRGARLKGAKIGNTNFSGATCSNANLSDMTSFLTPLGVDFSGANLEKANFTRSTLYQADFSGANLSGADLIEADVSRQTKVGARGKLYELSEANFEDADLSGAVLIEAKLRYARLRQARLRGARLEECNLEGADLRQADLSGARMRGANLKGADLRSAILKGTDLLWVDFSGANLRDIGVGNMRTTLLPFHKLPFKLDDCYIRDTRFSPRVSDPWSILRRSYTGPLFLMHLILLTLFAVPYVGRAVFWVGVNRIEEASVECSVAAIRHASDKLKMSTDPDAIAWANKAGEFVVSISPETRGKSAEEHTAMVGEVHSLLTEASDLVNSEDFEAKQWGEQASSLIQLTPASIKLRQRRVITLLLGWDKGWGYFSLVVCLLLYNAGRAWLTYWTGLMRDEEDRSGHCPAWAEYKRLYTVHKAVALLLFLASLSFGFHVCHWLTLPILLPG